jgi:hypothetical protein
LFSWVFSFLSDCCCFCDTENQTHCLLNARQELCHKLHSQPICTFVPSLARLPSLTLNFGASCLSLPRGCHYRCAPPHLACIFTIGVYMFLISMWNFSWFLTSVLNSVSLCSWVGRREVGAVGQCVFSICKTSALNPQHHRKTKTKTLQTRIICLDTHTCCSVYSGGWSRRINWAQEFEGKLGNSVRPISGKDKNKILEGRG